MHSAIVPPHFCPADAFGPAEVKLLHRAPGVATNISGPQEDNAQSPQATHVDTATWAVLDLISVASKFIMEIAPFALKPLLKDVVAIAQPSAESEGVQIPGVFGATEDAAPRNNKAAATNGQKLLNITATRAGHVGHVTTATVVVRTARLRTRRLV